jgi:hypothetical protein
MHYADDKYTTLIPYLIKMYDLYLKYMSVAECSSKCKGTILCLDIAK